MDEVYLGKATILYVEDDSSIRDFLAKRLNERVLKIYVAKNGKEGLELYKKYKPDIVLTDVKMPKMNGIEMSKEIKNINKKTPIVISSAHNDSEFLLDAIELGVNGYLLKPIDKIRLFEVLEENVKVNFMEQELILKKQQLLHQSRFSLLGEMVSMIAHQWRQPLHFISLVMTSLSMKFNMNKFDLETEEGRKNLPYKVDLELIKVEDKVKILSSIIDDFATFYKPNDEIESLHINQTIKEAIKVFSNSLDSNIIISEEYNSNRDIKIYKDVFIQICINLLNNSNENFIQKEIKEPKIFISTNDYDNGVEFKIKDNAGGIDKEIIDKIFDPYFSTKVGKNGNGLGLYMSKLVIEEHLNGEISVSNINGGAQFTIKLNVYNE